MLCVLSPFEYNAFKNVCSDWTKIFKILKIFFLILKNRVVIALMQSRPRQICYEHLLFKSYFWKVLVSCTNTLWYSEGGTLKLLSVQTRFSHQHF
jgi:hypothetical protein